MVEKHTRLAVWNTLLDVERMCRYYEAVYSKAARYHFFIRLTTLLLITGSIAAILELLPAFNDLAKGLVVTTVAGLTIWDALANYSKKATVSQVIYVQCSKIRLDLRDLWVSIEDKLSDTIEARQRLYSLSSRIEEVTQWGGLIDLQIDRKTNKATTEGAYAVVKNRYDPGYHTTKTAD